MNIRETAINRADYRDKVPYNMFRRVDLSDSQLSHRIPFKTDFGGNYLMKRLVARWSGKGSGVPEQNYAIPLTFQRDATYYVDLERTGYGYAGTEIDPWSFEDLHGYTFFETVENALFLIRGISVGTPSYEFYWARNERKHVYYPWDMEQYGRWGFSSEYSLFQEGGTVTVYGAVIETFFNGAYLDLQADQSGTPVFFNSYIKCKNYFMYGGATDYIHGMYGCTLSADAVLSEGTGAQDTFIKCNTLNSFGVYPSEFLNCAIDGTNFLNFLNLDNCHETWIAPVLPDWNSSDTNLFSPSYMKTNTPDIVFNGVGAPFNQYPSGLWGIVRYAIGALYFGVPYVNDVSDIKINLQKMTSNFAYFKDLSPHLISSPAGQQDTEAFTAINPVDSDLLNINCSGSKRMSYKSFNWLIEDNATIIIDVIKEFPSLQYPSFIDLVVEGYFIP